MIEPRKFTPRKSESSGERLEIFLTEASWSIYDQWTIGQTILVSVTGDRFLVMKADCGLPYCYCDAYVVDNYGPIAR